VVFRFGDHVLDIERRELRRGAEPIALEPQVPSGVWLELKVA
jgi:DNA-binding winged helix-turn-helix (wHTH) protein